MQISSITFGIRFVLVTLVLLAGISLVRGDDFSGAWVMNANGWKFTLKIEQKDDTVTGIMTGINNDETSKIEGKVNGNKITFTRTGNGDGQRYEGYLLNDDPANKENNQAVAGIAKAGNVPFGWYATRQRVPQFSSSRDYRNGGMRILRWVRSPILDLCGCRDVTGVVALWNEPTTSK